jgi:hypothetical protein
MISGTGPGKRLVILSSEIQNNSRNRISRPGDEVMTEPERITPEEVHQKLKAGKALLVCAYKDEAKFKMMRLQGAISFNEFKSGFPSLTKE